MVNIAKIDSDGMFGLKLDGLVDHELVLVKGRTSNLVGSIEANNEKINDESIELEDKRSELKSHQQSIIVGMIHILKTDYHIVFSRHVVSNVMVNYQSQQSI